MLVRYRPHPAGPNVLKSDQTLSVELSLGSESRRLSNGGLPPLDLAYCDDLNWADIVIGLPTTFILESLPSRLPVIVDYTHDGLHSTSPGYLWFKYAHMRQLVDLPGLLVGSTANEVPHHIVDAINNDFAAQIDHEELSNLLSLEETSFSRALMNSMEKVNDGPDTTTSKPLFQKQRMPGHQNLHKSIFAARSLASWKTHRPAQVPFDRVRG